MFIESKQITTILVAALIGLLAVLAPSCGGGGGGSSNVGGTVTVDSDTGNVEGYVYEDVIGDSAYSLSRTTDRPNGRIPLVGASVEVDGNTTSTNSNGFYRISRLAPGTRTIYITKPGYRPIKIIIIIIRNQTVTPDDEVDDDVVLEPEVDGSISITSEPAGAVIYLDGQMTSFITPNTLENITTGDHDVYVEMDGYDTPAASTVNVTAGDTVSTDFTLQETVVVEEDPEPEPAGLNYVIVDTNQTACYSDSIWTTCAAIESSFYGQDASYTGAQPSYTDNGDGTITDNNTGLMWQQDPGAKMTQSQAAAGADSFTLAGYSDWRLPQ